MPEISGPVEPVPRELLVIMNPNGSELGGQSETAQQAARAPLATRRSFLRSSPSLGGSPYLSDPARLLRSRRQRPGSSRAAK